MCTYLVKNGQNLIRSQNNVSFSDIGKGVISRDVVFEENFMLKSTQGKEQ
jgi:hypothetical protein